MNYSIYSLSHPESGQTFYVGQTKRNIILRMSQHIADAYRKDKKPFPVGVFLLALLAENKQPTVKLLENVSGELKNALACERKWIKRFTDEGVSLFNVPSELKTTSGVEVEQYSLDGELLVTYGSLYSAGKATGINTAAISMKCENGLGISSGFIWAYTSKGAGRAQAIKELAEQQLFHQYTLDGEYVRSWNNIKACAAELGLSPHALAQSVFGRTAVTGSHYWSRIKAGQYINPKDTKTKRVYQYSRAGELLKTWHSSAIAAKELELQENPITLCARGQSHSSYGFVWAYAPIKNFGKRKWGAYSTPIDKLTKDGEYVCTYKSLTKAAEATGTSFKAISQCALGKSKTSGGYKWKYHEI